MQFSVSAENQRRKRMFSASVYFGVLISLLYYEAGTLIRKKLKHPVFNPLLIAIILVIVTLLVFRIPYSVYYSGAKYLSYLLTPATIALAVPLYEKVELLKKDWKAIFAGITAGVLTSLTCILVFALLFDFSNAEYVTLLPKSITTAIGIDLSSELGGYPSLTAAIIIVTGVFGNIFAEVICKIFRIKDPVSKGIAIGTSTHAVGTAKAMEMGETEGAMSSLAIAISGLLTVVGASLFASFIGA